VTNDIFFVRDALRDDVLAIVSFNSRLASETEGKTLDRAVLTSGVLAALDNPDRLRYWVAQLRETGQIIGQAAISREWTDWRNGWLWWLQSVYVLAEFRGRGVFRNLYSTIRQQARDDGNVVGLRLYVENENSRARSTYVALGMKPGGYEVLEEIWSDRFGGRV
jgi:GNAT superfamily N-acetyltransferase